MFSPPTIDNQGIRDERWVIKTFRPLLKLLDVQHIPVPPNFKLIFVDKREWIIQGMGRCIVVIEQQRLPGNRGGMLVISHDTELDYFRLHILINSSLCTKTNLAERIEQKIAAVHEFTHIVAALSAISRVRSKELIKLLKDKFQKKAHAIYYDDIKQVAAELSDSLSIKLNNLNNTNKQNYFPDEHFRLGFEYIPVSYPVIFEELLLSKEMFEEYFSKDVIQSICEALSKRAIKDFSQLVAPLTIKIAEEKALSIQFVASRILDIFMPIYTNYSLSSKKNA